MDNQVVKLELPSGGSERHIASISKALEAIPLSAGTYKAGTVLATLKFSKKILKSTIADLGFKTLEVYNTYIMFSSTGSCNFIDKLNYRICGVQRNSSSSAEFVSGWFEIVCEEDIVTTGSSTITPIVYSRALLSNCTASARTLHLLVAS